MYTVDCTALLDKLVPVSVIITTIIYAHFSPLLRVRALRYTQELHCNTELSVKCS